MRFTHVIGAVMTHPVLSALGLTATESGTYLGRGEWSTTTDAGVLEPVNPSTGEVIGKVYASSAADYEIILERAQAAFKVWRSMPAPKRGLSKWPRSSRKAPAKCRK